MSLDRKGRSDESKNEKKGCKIKSRLGMRRKRSEWTSF
jgi:hypothetical protein